MPPENPARLNTSAFIRQMVITGCRVGKFKQNLTHPRQNWNQRATVRRLRVRQTLSGLGERDGPINVGGQPGFQVFQAGNRLFRLREQFASDRGFGRTAQAGKAANHDL